MKRSSAVALLCALGLSSACSSVARRPAPALVCSANAVARPAVAPVETGTALELFSPDVRPAPQADDDEELAKKLSNPVANLISVPYQLNYDQDIGPGDAGERWQLNFQPVVPIELNEDWNVISRTIIPFIDQSDVPPGDQETGIGDVTQSLFYSPKEPTADGLVWGVGPVLLLPFATDDTLGADKWGIGPTAVVLQQEGPWTVGALVNHIWSVAGDDDRRDISSTFLQPFAAYTTPEAWTLTMNSESTYDWKGSDWSVPLNVVASKVLRFGKFPVSVGGGLRYWLESADGGPQGFGLRFVVTLLLPAT